VVFSGLSLATVLTLFIIPCFYTLLHELFSGGGNNQRGKPSSLPESEPQETAIV
jgi:hypothetical protein